jgi:PBP1b-binding outer membrane lipoprotein LpoB
MKKIVSLALVLTMLFCAFVLSSCTSNLYDSNTKNEEEFYKLVDETKDLLDIVADDIYSYWYDCIYEDKYLENISYAVACAKSDNEENINTIEANTTKIKDLYKKIKDGKLSAEAKAVMQAYNDYYTLVVEVSGSFNSYSASKETCKKELASALDDFSFELD